MVSKSQVLFFAGLSLLAACSRAPDVQAPVRAVKVIEVGNASLSTQSEFTAEIKARVESRLGLRVGGKLVARHVELGQRVKAGQLLAEIEAQDLRLSVDSARAQLHAAQTTRDLAAADFKRYKELRDKEFISGAELEHRESALKSAQAQLEQAQTALAAQGNQLSYSKLFADKAGVITGLDAEVGQVVSAGTPIVRLAHDGPRDAVFAVPEDQLEAIKSGQTVKVKLWGSSQWVQAKVHEISASADPATRTFAAKAAIDDMKIPLGSTATVLVQQASAVNSKSLLPTSALRQEAGKSSVWIVDTASMSVRSQAVEVSGVQDNMAIISSGLQPGQKVVTAGVHVLSPGQKVTFYKTAGEQP